MDGGAGPGPGDKGQRVRGSSSDGIHTEDVGMDVVGGEQSFLRFCWPAAAQQQNTSPAAHSNSPVFIRWRVTVAEEVMTA